MVDRARLLLDRLMGQNRDVYGVDSLSINSDICIFSIAGLCPYETLSNTKMDIGKCKYKIHGVRDSKLCKTEYEVELLRFLIEISKYIKTQTIKTVDKNEEIILKERQIDLKIRNVREVGAHGDVKQSYLLAEDLKKDIEDLGRIKESYYVNNKDKAMPRCLTCGITVITNYGSTKYKTHVKGKLHRGIEAINDKLGELINKVGEEETLKIFQSTEFHYLNKKMG
ncbi:Luc7-like protein 3 [Nosema granulosis]|uniref:Luc7-like protein 3 n=1 Tax=Nosema granulosis TaxID=83296 RepID=A0A9P6H051_9MICR|nr:Luc7-like protein 3 [Nosema granulosis]